jgi:16S rRNA (cytosine1402-N4)-methyltransferase
MASHQPALVQEALEGLAVVSDGCYVDGTYGRGGHSAEILERLGGEGRLLALDKDPEAAAHGRARFADDPRVTVLHTGFESLRGRVEPWLQGRPLAGVLLDLGVSSPQLEAAERGFSFAKDGPLDMRMNTAEGRPASAWLAGVGQAELAKVLADYGEEPRARQLAAAIVKARARKPIATTRELAEIVERHSPQRPQRLHPATRVFQALRIQINAELASLESALAQSLELLGPGGRLCVISFHSLEDRLVKRFINRESRGDPAYAGLPNRPRAAMPRLKKIGGLIRPSAAELTANPRARSARLRVAEKLDAVPSC